jgi:hypothetical protein
VHRLRVRELAAAVAFPCFGNGVWTGQPIALSLFEEYKKMPLLNIVVVLVVVGVILYLINRFIPMAGSIKTILNIVVVCVVCVWVLQAIGLWSTVTSFRLKG